MALIALMSARSPGSTLNLAKLLSFTIIPVFIIGPVAGVYVDRYPRKRIMIISDILQGMFIISIPLLLMDIKDKILPIYIAVFLSYSVTRFFLTSKLSIIPDLVKNGEFLAANSLSSTTAMIAAVLGFGVGGLLVEVVGVKGGFYIDSFTFFLSAAMLFLINVKETSAVSKEAGNNAKNKSIIREFIEGLNYILRDLKILFVSGIQFLLMSGVGAVYVVIIVFIQQTLGSATRHLGFMVMFLGAGLFGGSVLFGGFGKGFSKAKVIFSSLVICGVLVISFALLVKLFPSFLVAAGLAFMIGFSISPIAILNNTLLHEVIPSEMRGKVFSSLEIVSHIAFMSFMFLSALLGEYLDRAWILIFIGALFSIFGIIGLFLKFRYEKLKL